jgi:hypothetical protein
MASAGKLVQKWNDPPINADKSDPASGCNWVAYNGGVGPAQLRWLGQELRNAQDAHQRVVVISHCPIHPGSVNNRMNTLLWNYAEVLDVLAVFPQVVAATFTGALLLSGPPGNHVAGPFSASARVQKARYSLHRLDRTVNVLWTVLTRAIFTGP